jgi:hypothetical protein
LHEFYQVAFQRKLYHALDKGSVPFIEWDNPPNYKTGNIFGTNERLSTNPDIHYDICYLNQARILGIPEARNE